MYYFGRVIFKTFIAGMLVGAALTKVVTKKVKEYKESRVREV